MSFTPDKVFRMQYGYGLKVEDIEGLDDVKLRGTDYTHLEIWRNAMWCQYQITEKKMNNSGWNIIQLDISGAQVLRYSHQVNRLRDAKKDVLAASGQTEKELLENERIGRCTIGTEILEGDLKASDFAKSSPYRGTFSEFKQTYKDTAKKVMEILDPVKNAGGEREKSYNYWKNLPSWLDKVA